MGSPYLRFLAMVVATAIALHVAWLLIRPVLPFLIVVVALIGAMQLVRWWRNRR
jgi:hypothetical protein